MEKGQVSRPQYVMPTYLGVLSSAIARASEAAAVANANIREFGWYWGAVVALWNILPPDVRKAVAERLGIRRVDDYVFPKGKEYARKRVARLVEKYGLKTVSECLEIPKDRLLDMLKREGIIIDPEEEEQLDASRRTDCSKLPVTQLTYENEIVSARIEALDEVLQTIIDELYKHGWLTKEETTLIGCER